jgi:hypothetical protein
MREIYCDKFDYKLARSFIQNGDVLACSGDHGFSLGIKKFESDPALRINGKLTIFTHVGTFLWIFEELFVIEAVNSVRCVRFSTAYKNYDGRLFVLRPEFKNSVEAYDFMRKQAALVGKDYDWQDIKDQALNKLGIDKTHIEDDEWFCSEMVNYASRYKYGKPKDFTTPHQIAMQLKFITELYGVGL